MSSTTSGGAKRHPNTSPQTAERIRDAAIAEFAAHGFGKTTVRGIALAAGVSPGLVIHHFGSKDGLRTACDDHVFTELTDTKLQAHASVMNPLMATAAFMDERMTVYLDYLTKSMLDPSEHGQRFFDHYVEVIEQAIKEGFAGYAFRRLEDRRAQAATVAALGLAPMILQQRLQSVLGTEDLTATFTRLTPALFDLFTNGVLESFPEHVTAALETTGAQTDTGAQPPTGDAAQTDTAQTDAATNKTHPEP